MFIRYIASLLITAHLVAALISLGTAVGVSLPAIAAPAAGTGQEMGRSLEDRPQLPLPVRQYYDTLLRYYVEASGSPLWIGTGRMAQFVAVLRSAEDHGLSPADYPADYLAKLLKSVDRMDLQGRVSIEQIFSAHFLKFAADLKTGRLLPQKIDPELYWKTKRIDLLEALSLLARTDDVSNFISRWEPQIPEYAALKAALQRYRALAADGGWPTLPGGDVLKPGMEDPRVPTLRRRLAATERDVPLAGQGTENIYDEKLADALKQFQARHGLEPDGILGPQSLFQLNISAEARVRQIIANMERWRWMPEDLGDHYVIVNIAGFELKRVRAERTEERMRVVVGKPYHRTPVFSDRMEYLEINPYWNVPGSIATREELPKLQSDPSALAERGFEVVRGDEVVDVRAIDWSRYSRSNFPFRLRQRPGPRNALGRVKFMFPNKFNVYLHDTPSRSLFARAQRAFSHGCIRVARPIDLAEQILNLKPGWSRERIEDVLASGDRTVVTLDDPVDVHITYATAWRRDDNTVHFAPDIYRRDEALRRALFGKPTPS